MLQPARRPYVCWQCVAQSRRRFDAPAPLAVGHFRQRPEAPKRRWATTKDALSSAKPYGQANIPKHLPEKGDGNEASKKQRNLPVRDRLQRWLNEECEGYAQPAPPDMFIYGTISNNLSRTHNTGSSELHQLKSGQQGMDHDIGGIPSTGDAEIGIIGVDSRTPGDLVEMKQSGSRVPMFGVYLGFFGDRHHFYAANGQWTTSVGFSALFTVSGFVNPAELNDVVAKIPRNATPEQFDELRRDEKGPSREDGAKLIQQMSEFRNQAEAVYQANIGKLDAAQAILASPREIKYLSLFEMANTLLHPSLRDSRGFPPHALYAVHATLLRNELGFYPINPSSDCHRRDHLFEIFSHKHSKLADKITVMVREYTELSADRLKPPSADDLERTLLGKFIQQARDSVAFSRRSREWTSHGTLKASTGVSLPKIVWSQPSNDIITFLEWWASYDLFDVGSRYHAYGALILRALRLYENVRLDQSTAWVFLQEIGVIPAWEIPSRYRVRFPETSIIRGGGWNRELPNIEKSMRPDIAAGSRKTWDNTTVFCIDAPTTTLIDDGVSLQRTDKADEFWIHIHTADPASAILPHSDLRKFMELIPENIYLPGHFQAMLPSDLGKEDPEDSGSESLVDRFSLRPGGPALTFSAKVNKAGEILDYNIEPSNLTKVTYLDPEDVSQFCDEPAPPPSASEYSLAVGAPPAEEEFVPSRPMVAAKDLDQAGQDDLRTLYQLAEAIKGKRLAKGAWPYFFPRPSVSVAFHEGGTNELPDDATVVPPDPYIKIGHEESTGCSVVANTMVLAGEIAARWCASRGVAIPYRKDIKSEQNLDAAFSYATKEIYPQIKQGIEPPMSQRQELSRLTGGLELSTRPGPYFLLGLDMYAKATSPLRRFSDLLVHWQIHGALAYERKNGRRVDPSLDAVDSLTPFQPAELDNMLPLLQLREKTARVLSRGSVEWILLALVRAWRDEKTAPRVMTFTVGSLWRHGVLGQLDLFKLNASMGIAELDGRRLMKEMKVGDRFEVELVDVNVHSRQILVKALRYLGSDKRSDQEQQQQQQQQQQRLGPDNGTTNRLQQSSDQQTSVGNDESVTDPISA